MSKNAFVSCKKSNNDKRKPRFFFDKYRVADEYSADSLNRLTSESNDSKIAVLESSQDESGPGAMRSLLTWSCVCISFSFTTGGIIHA